MKIPGKNNTPSTKRPACNIKNNPVAHLSLVHIPGVFFGVKKYDNRGKENSGGSIRIWKPGK